MFLWTREHKGISIQTQPPRKKRRRSINTFINSINFSFPIFVSEKFPLFSNFSISISIPIPIEKEQNTNYKQNNIFTNAPCILLILTAECWFSKVAFEIDWSAPLHSRVVECNVYCFTSLFFFFLQFRIPICQLIKWTCCDVNCVVCYALMSWFVVVILARHYITGWIFVLFCFCLFIFYRTNFFCFQFKHHQRQHSTGEHIVSSLLIQCTFHDQSNSKKWTQKQNWRQRKPKDKRNTFFP